MAHCINWTGPTVNLKYLVNNCFYVPLTSRNIIFSTCMLLAVPPQNRHFQVMKPSQSVACVWVPLSFFLTLPISVYPCHPLHPDPELLFLLVLQCLGRMKWVSHFYLTFIHFFFLLSFLFKKKHLQSRKFGCSEFALCQAGRGKANNQQNISDRNWIRCERRETWPPIDLPRTSTEIKPGKSQPLTDPKDLVQ